MIKKTLTSVAFVIAFITLCYAVTTDITGHWSGNINGKFDVAYDFKVDGAILTGTTTGPDGNKIAIVGGVIKDDSLSFTFPMQDQQLKVTGKINSPELITLKMGGTPMGDMTFDIKKSN